MKMKMWIGNLDGQREGLVITPTKKRAIEILHTTTGDFNNYWRSQPLIDATLTVETLYTRPFTSRGGGWQQGRCPIPPKETK